MMKALPVATALALGLVVASGVRANELDGDRGCSVFVTMAGISGESKQRGHENQVCALHYSETWRADSSWTKGGGASVGKPNPGPVVFTKEQGPATLQLLRKITSGQSVTTAVFEFYDTARDGSVRLTYKVSFTELFLVGVNEKLVDGKVLDEIQLIFKTGRWETFDPPEVHTWDVPAGTSSAKTPAGSGK